jgi:deferrochelatase/peroxidase EfeB
MKNPAQFVQLQNALAADALNEYIHHTGSAVFACPPPPAFAPASTVATAYSPDRSGQLTRT